MAGVARLRVQFSFTAQGKLYAPERGPDAVLSIAEGSGGVIAVSTGVTDQVLTAPGITAITGFYLLADQAISVKIGVVGTNTAFTLAAGYPITALGISTTALYLTNASGSTANISYVIVGA